MQEAKMQEITDERKVVGEKKQNAKRERRNQETEKQNQFRFRNEKGETAKKDTSSVKVKPDYRTDSREVNTVERLTERQRAISNLEKERGAPVKITVI